jgi:hypothetical protein
MVYFGDRAPGERAKPLPKLVSQFAAMKLVDDTALRPLSLTTPRGYAKFQPQPAVVEKAACSLYKSHLPSQIDRM